MIFKDYHIPMIRSGSKTATRREWSTRQAKPGNVYMAVSTGMIPDGADYHSPIYMPEEHCSCYIRVESVREQPLGDMTDEEAQAEGDYADLPGFQRAYERVYGDGAWDPEKEVVVVEFEYVGRERP